MKGPLTSHILALSVDLINSPPREHETTITLATGAVEEDATSTVYPNRIPLSPFILGFCSSSTIFLKVTLTGDGFMQVKIRGSWFGRVLRA